MNKRKLLSALLAGAIAASFLSGCQTDQPPAQTQASQTSSENQESRAAVGDPPVQIEERTVNGKNDYVTFVLNLPDNWFAGSASSFTATAFPEDLSYRDDISAIDQLPLVVTVTKYYKALTPSPKEKQMYQDLFAGNPAAFEEEMNKMSVPPDLSEVSGSMDLFGLLGPGSEVERTDIEYSYQQYAGAHGPITTVEYSVPYEGTTVHMIDCYREDIPYKVTGALSDSVDLPSGKIALWVADSLQVTEHYTSKGGVTKAED